jgi:hypothetical protein
VGVEKGAPVSGTCRIQPLTFDILTDDRNIKCSDRDDSQCCLLPVTASPPLDALISNDASHFAAIALPASQPVVHAA